MFYVMGVSDGANQERTNKQTSTYAANAANDVQKHCGRLTGAELTKCATEIVEANRESQRNESDLGAQWRAANWVMWATIIAGVQLILSGFGIWALVYTLRQSERGLEFSSRTYDAFIALERPRLIITVASVVPVTAPIKGELIGGFRVTIQATNIGKAACVVKHVAKAWQSDNICGEIFTGMPEVTSVPSEATEDVCAIDYWPTHSENKFVGGYVVYASPLSPNHLSYFCFEIRPKASGGYNDPKWFDQKSGGGWPEDT